MQFARPSVDHTSAMRSEHIVRQMSISTDPCSNDAERLTIPMSLTDRHARIASPFTKSSDQTIDPRITLPIR